MRALEVAAKLYGDVLCDLATGNVSFKRQFEWEGTTYCALGSAGNCQATVPAEIVEELQSRLAQGGSYAFHEPPALAD
jgi:hypothetical protein